MKMDFRESNDGDVSKITLVWEEGKQTIAAQVNERLQGTDSFYSFLIAWITIPATK